jgi:hypothetical protein
LSYILKEYNYMEESSLKDPVGVLSVGIFEEKYGKTK